MTLVNAKTGEIVGASLVPMPVPGSAIVPAGWCDKVMVPWLAEQTDQRELARSNAQLRGLEDAYRALNLDTLELVKARRHLEVRWGELLGQGKPGPQPESSLASEDSLDKDSRYRFRQLADNRLRVEELLAEATDADELSRAALLRAVLGAHVGNNAGDNEWYTPEAYIKAATEVMGAIDLDPASSEAANEVVCASTFFTEDDNGLRKDWAGRVWMNPPYSRPIIDHFCAKLAESYATGDVTEACVLVNNATETGWFHALAEVASAMCFPRHRVKFWHPSKQSAPLQGQAVIYLGENVDAFRDLFVDFGFTVTL